MNFIHNFVLYFHFLACFENLIHKAHYTCPICNTSMIDMKAVWSYFDNEIEKSPMPLEYANSTVCILCRDCHQVNYVVFLCY